MSKIALILGDQLSENIATLKYIDKSKDFILMAEVKSEASYVKHHKHKIILIFSAMRHFAKELEQNGYQVIYSKYNDVNNSQTIKGEIKRVSQERGLKQLIITKPGEYRLLKELESLQKDYDINFHEDDRFFASLSTFNSWVKGRKELTLEYYYRKLRQDNQILMHNNKPIGGKWNYDKENRKTIKDSNIINKELKFDPDEITKEVIDLVKSEFKNNIGDADNFNYCVTKEDAQKAFQYFLDNNLESYGMYQDTMMDGQSFLFHSLISPYLNIGLLCPKYCCKMAQNYYHENKAPLNSVEGFIRQILGWREFIRGVYWHHMPGYCEKNFLNHKNDLPEFYWNANTKLNCLKNAIKSTINHAYSHHIQRLMITGNFALLTQIEVMQIHQWYLAVYIDAFEWVESPNTIGMSQYGDGGIVATKPYISGGAYINRMSNYCKNCYYDVKTIDSENSCPFNYLYWNFLIIHQDKFRKNHRMAIAYNNLDKMSEKKQKDIIEKSKYFINNLNK
tara:strand:- start:369 stop:1889 length:1521 start_codon:yes stop_codon:yes gene_type:complete